MDTPGKETKSKSPQSAEDQSSIKGAMASESNTNLDSKNTLVLPEQLLPPNLFVLPANSPPVFPTLMAPMIISDARWISTVEESISRNRLLGVLLTKKNEVSANTKFSDLYEVGVVVKIIKRLKLPDGSINILVHSMKRFRAKKILSDHPHLVVETEYLDDVIERSTEFEALTRATIGQVKKLSEVNPFFTDEMRLAMINAPGPGTVADLVAFALSLEKAQAQEILETISVKERFEKILVHLKREQDLADVQTKISSEVNQKVSKLQREYFLKEQLKIIKRELGVEEDGKEKNARTFKERIEAAGMPEEVKKTALDELERFETLNESSPEYNLTRNYLEALVSLPWSIETKDTLDLTAAKIQLDQDHFGLEKVKQRILEFLAVRKLKQDPKGSILCLVGPPGVGKTSVGKTIAKTMGRKFFRFSLGGMRDEAEIKGHRRTYIGAMPGKVMQGLKRAGSKNAVIMLDEIDKLGQSFQGDPASALLEVLDPEQNAAFLDHYLDVPFDLSKVLFIATANSTNSIPSALLDRMEVIELPGYLLEEKEDIARKFLLPRELENHGLKTSQLRMDRQAIRRIIQDYAREPGVRVLQQQIGKIARKAAFDLVKHGEGNPGTAGGVSENPGKFFTRIKAEELEKWLGPIRYFAEVADRPMVPGLSIGLAWTQSGGDILFIETTETPGTGQLKFTGQMGEVMAESAQIAWTVVKRQFAIEKKVTHEYFKDKDFHLHIPAGAIPKDGPSAGISMATSLYSWLHQMPIGGVNQRPASPIAMTGELSLTGRVLPVGGIKEKLLAALRAGVKEVILPILNKKDMAEVPEHAKQKLKIHFVSEWSEVVGILFGVPAAKITRSIPRKKKLVRPKSLRKNFGKKLLKKEKRPGSRIQRVH